MTGEPVETKPKPARRWLWITLSVVLLILVVLVLFDTEDTADVARNDRAAPAPIVSVLTVEAGEARATVSVFAELRPRWDAELRSAVAGRITEVHPGALAGARVAQGDPLFSIEKAQYQTAVAVAEMELEQARLDLLRAENNVTVTRKQFERDGVEPPTELALQLPQLRIATKAVASAKARLRAAQRALADTDVVAPFSGFVTGRLASLGQTVSPGDPLAHLADDRRFELIAELSQADWALLEHPIAGGWATLSHRDGTALGRARIRHGGGYLDPETRQVRVFLDVSDPEEGVLAGDFLRVSFPGRVLSDTLTLPEGSISRAGYVWLVGDDDLLQRLRPEILFRAGDTVTIAAPSGAGPWQVAQTPLAAFLPGQRVTPQAGG